MNEGKATAENCRELTAEQIRAANLIALDEGSPEEIAAQVNISVRQLFTWRQYPEFQAKVKEYLAELEAGMRRLAIAKKRERIAALQRRWRRLEQVIEERAASPEMQHVPGGKTGLIVHNVKGVGKGDDFQLIDLYEVDTGLLREMREHEIQAAKELGQWVDKVAPTTPDGQQTYEPISAERRESIYAAIMARMGVAGLGMSGNGNGSGHVGPLGPTRRNHDQSGPQP